MIFIKRLNSLVIWISLIECLVVLTGIQKDRYVVREDEPFEIDCIHNLQQASRVKWEYFSKLDSHEIIYDSQLPKNILKSGFEVSCEPHETLISTCSLKLVRARKEDSGKYICFVGEGNEAKFDSNALEAVTEIEMVVRGPVRKTTALNSGDSVILPCEHNIKNLTRARWSHVSTKGVITYSLFHLPLKDTLNSNYKALCEPHELFCNLKILGANKESAGKYICLIGESHEFEEKYGLDPMTHFIEIELIIGELLCNENMKKDLTLLGENDCYGIEADVLNLKCSFNYFGNINYNLHLRWIEKYKFNSLEKKLNSSPINHEVKDETKNISIQTNLSVAYEMQNSIFQCVLDDTQVKPCQLHEFRTQYVKNITERSPPTYSNDLHNMKCLANKSANVQCSYYWVHQIAGATVENPHAILLVENMNSPGIYTCIAKCHLENNKECFIKAMEVEVVQGSNNSVLIYALLSGLVIGTGIAAILLCVIYRKYVKKIQWKIKINSWKALARKDDDDDDDDDDVKELLRGQLKRSSKEYLKKIASGNTIIKHDNRITHDGIQSGENVWRVEKTCFTLLNEKKILHEERSMHHDIKIYESTKNGDVFLLDGAIWSTQYDAWDLKALTSISLISHEEPKDILVIGGGDGVIAKHLLQHQTVESITVYEVDKRILTLSCKYFPSLEHSLDDPKVKVHIGDGNEFMKKQKNVFDVIFIRSSTVQDIYFDNEYYKVIKGALKDGGCVYVTITGKELEDNDPDKVMEIKAVVDQIFSVVNYFYIPFREHPGTLMRCLMCGLNDGADFMNMIELLREVKFDCYNHDESHTLRRRKQSGSTRKEV